MDFDDIRRQLYDLPSTFIRQGAPYNQIIDSLASALYLLAQSSTSLNNQYVFSNTYAGWTDVWGAIAGFIRNTTEADPVFLNRIENTVLAWRDSLVAIEKYCSVVENLICQITEKSPVGYNINFLAVTDTNVIQQAVNDLKYIRPAGVPFTVSAERGTYLNTVNYYGYIGTPIQYEPLIGRITGAYLAVAEPLAISIPAGTNSAIDILPTLMFSDPTLNQG